MRQKVEDAPDAYPSLPQAAKTAEFPAADGERSCDPGGKITHDSFHI
jgi:hypothetical protein